MQIAPPQGKSRPAMRRTGETVSALGLNRPPSAAGHRGHCGTFLPAPPPHRRRPSRRHSLVFQILLIRKPRLKPHFFQPLTNYNLLQVHFQVLSSKIFAFFSKPGISAGRRRKRLRPFAGRSGMKRNFGPNRPFSPGKAENCLFFSAGGLKKGQFRYIVAAGPAGALVRCNDLPNLSNQGDKKICREQFC